ncbi:acidstable alpha-amylase [Stylonychia lemnae]|uniref:alpha-amylase n=1 Tax=Stylonychia lemnae TaxID=5949 RepID=A0A078AG76_STYLE|nr:acidstable alpha-amylase [Stylonychia lemnae]|eukprot:CDW80492.1 acidstable alpha-amylase [Stylonychia lemnae]
MKSFKLISIYIISLLFQVSYTLKANGWKSQSIYQVLTDRIVIDGEPKCATLKEYCGGTFNDLIQLLPHIIDLGFTAIYISPFIENTELGYHGYWAQNIYKVNSNFGTEQELKRFIAKAHEQQILVMVDVVFNHVGYVPEGKVFDDIVPFNKDKHYHEQCEISPQDFETNNIHAIENCRLFGLPDLNTESDEVKDLLFNWIRNDVVLKYGFDGIRIDTVRHVNKRFWQELNLVLSGTNTFAIGEVSSQSPSIVGDYQTQAGLDSVLDFPLYHKMNEVFAKRYPIASLQEQYMNQKNYFSDMSLLGVFVDCHDEARLFNKLSRFAADKEDLALGLNALTYAFMSYGIPILYYGTEGRLNGGSDPLNREIYNPFKEGAVDQTMAKYIKVLNQVRSSHETYNYEPEFKQSGQDTLIFNKGPEVLVIVTNTENVHQTMFLQNHPFKQGDKLCNAFSDWDCVTVDENKRIKITIIHGYPKIYILNNELPPDQNRLNFYQGLFKNAMIVIFFIVMANILHFSGILNMITGGNHIPFKHDHNHHNDHKRL